MRVNSKPKVFPFALCVMLLALSFHAEAQQTKKVPRIGFLISSPPSADAARVEAFREGLRELGYLEGKNIFIEWRSAASHPRNSIRAREAQPSLHA